MVSENGVTTVVQMMFRARAVESTWFSRNRINLIANKVILKMSNKDKLKDLFMEGLKLLGPEATGDL